MRCSRIPLVLVVCAASGSKAVAGTDPLTNSPVWTTESNQSSANLGNQVASAGDVNGDGFADVIVGAYHMSHGQNMEGQAFVHLGSATGLSPVATWSAEANQAAAFLGSSVASAGDVNGDGYDDVIVGGSAFDNGQTDEGRAWVYLGSPTGLAVTPSWLAEGNQGTALFGDSCAGVGDVNGDGYSDVIIGAPAYSSGQLLEGRAFVYLGSAAGLGASAAWTAENNETNSGFGLSVASAGDVNGDGFSDVVVGAPDASNFEINEGIVYVHLGTALGPGAAPAWTFESNQTSGGVGISVASAGDVNGDGYSDIVTGSYRFTNGENWEGRAYAFAGGAGGLASSPAWTVESDQAQSFFGNSVASAGDVNADGYSDVLVGAWQFDAGQTNEGRAFAYLGSATGLGTLPAWTVEGDAANGAFGISVATAGDVNGNGFSDVIVGAHWFNAGQSMEGRAYVHHGGCGTNAAATAYGAGKPGTLGVPVLASSAPPSIGGTGDLTITGGLPGASVVFAFMGFAPAALPFDGGTLLVVPALTVMLPPLDAGGSLSLPVPIPGDSSLCGGTAWFQSGFVDPGASGPYHTALSNGVAWTLGG